MQIRQGRTQRASGRGRGCSAFYHAGGEETLRPKKPPVGVHFSMSEGKIWAKRTCRSVRVASKASKGGERNTRGARALHHVGGEDLGEQDVQRGGLAVPVVRIIVRSPAVQLVVVHGRRLQELVLLRA